MISNLTSRIELSPFTFPHSPTRIFTGSKHTSLITVDLRTGQQLDCFTSLAANTSDPESCVCKNDQMLDDMDGRARTNSDVLFVGRTDYRLTIHAPSPGSLASSVQEITYSTYTPNSFDKPLAEFWSKFGSSQKQWSDDGAELKSVRIELGHDGVAVGVETGGDVKWVTKLGSIGIGVYDILLPLSSSSKPILVPQPPPQLESLFPQPINHDQQQFDIHKKAPTTYIGSVPYQLALPPPETDSSAAPRPLQYALSSTSYPLIHFLPPAAPGVTTNGSFLLSENLPEKDQLLPYLLDPAVETEKTIDPAPQGGLLDGASQRTVGRGWIFWVLGVLSLLATGATVIVSLGLRKRSAVKQTATPPNEKEPLINLESEAPKPDPVTPVAISAPAEDELKPKKKPNRRRVRGRKKRSNSTTALTEKDSNEDEDPDGYIAISPPRAEKPLPELPRAISTVALNDTNDKEQLVISDNIIGESQTVFQVQNLNNLGTDSQGTDHQELSYLKANGVADQWPSNVFWRISPSSQVKRPSYYKPVTTIRMLSDTSAKNAVTISCTSHWIYVRLR